MTYLIPLIAGGGASASLALYFLRRRTPKATRRGIGRSSAETRAAQEGPKGESGLTMFDKLSRLFGPPRRALPGPVPSAAPDAPNKFDFEDERIPEPARVKMRRILACIEEVGKALQREQVPGFSRLDMEQMRDIHLPKLAQSYIDIPSGYRSEIFRKTGKSASFILLESLDKMQTKMDEILKNLAQSDIDAFTENAQFIGQRYGDEDNPFR